MLKLAFTFLLGIVSIGALAQNRDSINSLNMLNRKYQKEIDVAVQFLGSPGAAFIYKKKDNSGRLVELNSLKNYRFQVSLNGHIPLKSKTTIQDTLAYNRVSKDYMIYNVQAMFGYERVRFYGKFNLYYGCDIGPNYTYGRSGYVVETYPNPYSGTTVAYSVTDPYFGYSYGGGYGYSYTTNVNYGYTTIGSSFYLLREIYSIGFSAAPFIGAKYRFSEHLSASVESAFYLSYFFSRVRYSNPPIQPFNSKTSTTQEISGFDFAPRYLRFLTLNYHF